MIPSRATFRPAPASTPSGWDEFRGIYYDEKSLDALLQEQGDLVTYEVTEYRADGSDLFFGTTTMMPGCVGNEYFMTRGHYHARRDRGEIYYTQSGEGILLLNSRDGQTREVDMKQGVCAFIPPDWAHRSVNTGTAKLVFVWCCARTQAMTMPRSRQRHAETRGGEGRCRSLHSQSALPGLNGPREKRRNFRHRRQTVHRAFPRGREGAAAQARRTICGRSTPRSTPDRMDAV